MLLAIIALVAALGGSAVAGSVLTKKKVNRIITKRAPGLSVGKANRSETANRANAATNADTVGGVSIQPVTVALNEGGSTTLLDVDGSTVAVTCSDTGTVSFTAERGGSSPPITVQWIRHGQDPTVTTPPAGLGSLALNVPGGTLGFEVTVRTGSGRVTRLTGDAFHETDAHGGPQDCFAQGTLERFG
jgi:hypothetical protein